MDWREQLAHDHERFASGLPKPLELYILDAYGISLASTYAGLPVRNPFGKASGQLSLNVNQVSRDAEAGLGFVVLKTVIAQDASGTQSMKAWAIPATKMTVEEIAGTRERARNERGWTVTWKGRGWSDTFEAYLEFFRSSLEIAARMAAPRVLIVPSVKYHLPKPDEQEWRTEEYEHTTAKLYDAWRSHPGRETMPMPLEKDFSPSLAGDHSFSSQRETILNWLRNVPRIIRETSCGADIRLGLKIFNAAHSDDFQLEMLNECESNSARADYLIYGNRLFDPAKAYEGVRGVAYGGPDLSDRNLDILSQWKHTLPFSATGNIVTGSIAFEYLKRGATTFQMHTLFQLADTEFAMKGGTRTERALHRLLFHPAHGFLQALLSEKERRGWSEIPGIPELADFYVREKFSV
jgi:hypothetical protein